MKMVSLLCCGWLSMGCSFLFVRPPPSQHEDLAYFDCVSSDAAPAVDVVNALTDGVLAIAASVDNPNTDDKESRPGVAVGVGIVGAVYAASAIYGFVTTSNCESAKEGLRERVLKTRAERDQLLQAQSHQRAQPAGCQRDSDCKGTRVCANAACIEPPAAPVAPPPAAPAAAPTAVPAVEPAAPLPPAP